MRVIEYSNSHSLKGARGRKKNIWLTLAKDIFVLDDVALTWCIDTCKSVAMWSLYWPPQHRLSPFSTAKLRDQIFLFQNLKEKKRKSQWEIISAGIFPFRLRLCIIKLAYLSWLKPTWTSLILVLPLKTSEILLQLHNW